MTNKTQERLDEIEKRLVALEGEKKKAGMNTEDRPTMCGRGDAGLVYCHTTCCPHNTGHKKRER